MPYAIAFVVHMLGIISLFGGFILFQHAGARLRSAATWEEARLWASMIRVMPAMATGGSVFLLASGLYMAIAKWGMRTAWVSMGMAAVVVLTLLGVLVVKPAMEKVFRAVDSSSGPIDEGARNAIKGSPLWPWNFAMNSASLSILWLMSAKPGWGVSIALPLGFAILGALAGRALARR